MNRCIFPLPRFFCIISFATIIPAISRFSDETALSSFFILFFFFYSWLLPWVLKENDTKIFSSVRRIFLTLLSLYFVSMTPEDTLQWAPGILFFVCNELSQVILSPTTHLTGTPSCNCGWVISSLQFHLWNFLFVLSFHQSCASLLLSHYSLSFSILLMIVKSTYLH